MRNCVGVAVNANTVRVGRNDNGEGIESPQYGFVIEDCQSCIVKDNAMHNGSLVENIVKRGGLETCIISDNLGNVKI